MKRIIGLLLVCMMLFLALASADADSSFLSLSEEYIRQVTDFTEKNAVVMTASGYDSSKCIISFDFTDGNQTIVAIDGNQCEVFFFFEDNELMSALFQMIVKFDEVEARIPAGRKLEYEMRFSDTEIHHIAAETIMKYYEWIK